MKSRKQRFEEMLTDAPDDAELRYGLAMEYVGEGDDAGAVRCFEEIMRRNPNYPPAYHMAGRALLRLSRLEDARRVLERGIQVAQQQRDSHAAGEMQELLDNLE